MKLIENGELTFLELAAANEKRVIQFRNGKGELTHSVYDGGINNWSVAEWTNAMCGEAGEAANLAKKIRRGDYGDHNFYPERVVALKDLGFELAGVVIYADLCAQRIGLSLGDLIREKFNTVSDRVGSDQKL